MSADFPAPMDNADVKSDYPRDAEKELNLESATTEPAIDAMSEVLLDIDPVMSRKMHLVNNVCPYRAQRTCPGANFGPDSG